MLLPNILRISGLVRDIQVSKGISLLIQWYFCTVNDKVEKADLSKGYQKKKLKRKLGVTTSFSEIIELKFIYCLYFKVFLELWLPNYL